MKFAVDTSALLDGWQRYYPPDVFEQLWLNIEENIDKGSIVASEEVYREVERKHDDLHDWMMGRKHMLIESDEKVQLQVIEIMQRHERLVNTQKGRSTADPFVIAAAIVTNSIVVTGETNGGTPSRPRIPHVCDAEGVQWTNFLGMIRGLNLRY